MVAHGDWVSYHAALARGVDPMPVERIGELKRRVGEGLDLLSHLSYIALMRYEELLHADAGDARVG